MSLSTPHCTVSLLHSGHPGLLKGRALSLETCISLMANGGERLFMGLHIWLGEMSVQLVGLKVGFLFLIKLEEPFTYCECMSLVRDRICKHFSPVGGLCLLFHVVSFEAQK